MLHVMGQALPVIRQFGANRPTLPGKRRAQGAEYIATKEHLQGKPGTVIGYGNRSPVLVMRQDSAEISVCRFDGTAGSTERPMDTTQTAIPDDVDAGARAVAGALNSSQTGQVVTPQPQTPGPVPTSISELVGPEGPFQKVAGAFSSPALRAADLLECSKGDPELARAILQRARDTGVPDAEFNSSPAGYIVGWLMQDDGFRRLADQYQPTKPPPAPLVQQVQPVAAPLAVTRSSAPQPIAPTHVVAPQPAAAQDAPSPARKRPRQQLRIGGSGVPKVRTWCERAHVTDGLVVIEYSTAGDASFTEPPICEGDTVLEITLGADGKPLRCIYQEGMSYEDAEREVLVVTLIRTE